MTNTTDPVRALLASWFKQANDHTLTSSERAHYLGAAGMLQSALAQAPAQQVGQADHPCQGAEVMDEIEKKAREMLAAEFDAADLLGARDLAVKMEGDAAAATHAAKRHMERVDELLAENERLRAEFEFQAALTKDLLPYQERAVKAEARAERLAEALRGIRRDALDGCSAMDCARDAFDVLRELDLLREQENDDA